MSRLKFDIKFRPQIESGEYKVETNDHHPVRIICWNKNTGGFDRIVALVAGDSGNEKTLHYTEEGLCVASGGNKNKDLFIVTPEPELTEFEEAVKKLLDFAVTCETPYDTECIKTEAAELLTLARKQLQPEIDAEIEKAYKTADEVQYKKGRADVLKGFPRWKKVGLNTGQTTLMKGYTSEEDKLYRNGYVISLTDLEKLPKEEQTWK